MVGKQRRRDDLDNMRNNGVELPSISSRYNDSPCCCITDCRPLGVEGDFWGNQGHSGIHPDNYESVLIKPIAWGCCLDSDDKAYGSIEDMFKHRTDEIPGAALGGTLIGALKAFVNWLTLMCIDVNLGTDPQFVQTFLCVSGYDRSPAIGFGFCALYMGFGMSQSSRI